MCDIGKHISLRTLHHLIRDHQGSILLITVRGGAVQAEYRYDPWGGRLDPETRTYYAPGEEPELMFGRGYTGHEHLPEYGSSSADSSSVSGSKHRRLIPPVDVSHVKSSVPSACQEIPVTAVSRPSQSARS